MNAEPQLRLATNRGVLSPHQAALTKPRGHPDWWQHACTKTRLDDGARGLAKTPSAPSEARSVQLEDTESDPTAATTFGGSENPTPCLIYQSVAGQLGKSTFTFSKSGTAHQITHRSDYQINSTESPQLFIVQKQCN